MTSSARLCDIQWALSSYSAPACISYASITAFAFAIIGIFSLWEFVRITRQYYLVTKFLQNRALSRTVKMFRKNMKVSLFLHFILMLFCFLRTARYITTAAGAQSIWWASISYSVCLCLMITAWANHLLLWANTYTSFMKINVDDSRFWKVLIWGNVVLNAIIYVLFLVTVILQVFGITDNFVFNTYMAIMILLYGFGFVFYGGRFLFKSRALLGGIKKLTILTILLAVNLLFALLLIIAFTIVGQFQKPLNIGTFLGFMYVFRGLEAVGVIIMIVSFGAKTLPGEVTDGLGLNQATPSATAKEVEIQGSKV